MVSFNFFRYYYDKNIILKTAGKRYVYRFVCDLQGLLGYSPEEIHQMVDLKLEKKEEDWFFYIHEKRNSQEIEKRNCFTKFKKTEKRKSFQAIDGSHPPLTLSPNGVWRRQSRLDQSPPPTKKRKRIQVRERPSLKKSFALWPFLWHLSDDQKYYCDVNLPPAAKKN